MDMEPTLLLPIGFGTILVNLPLSGAVTQVLDGVKEIGIIDVLFNAGISNELFPLLLFIGIGAMIDFTPLMTNPKMLFFGAAAQFGIFFTFSLASLFGFDIKDAASIAIMGAADGPTSIFVANYFNSKYIGAIVVAAYSYMALVPIIQPFVIKRIVAGLVAPRSVALIGFLMFGNLIRECGVLNSLSESAQKELANLITILLGITISTKMQAEYFLTKETIMILLLGLVAFIFDTVGGVLFAKILNLFLKNKINPMVGAAGISAFPMSARVIHKMGLKEDPNNFLLMHAVGANVAGQIGSVIAGGMIINLVEKLL
jgi:Na+-transporting methylmalonyl-CoA/oxaloacetate decarboxylase beta subunit